MKKKILIIVCINISMPCTHALTIINKSELPATITQIILSSYDGLETNGLIKQTHISIAPEEAIDLAKESPTLSRIIGLTLAFNNAKYHFTIKYPHRHEYIIIEKETIIQLSPEIIHIEQELPISEKKPKESRFGPHLI